MNVLSLFDGISCAQIALDRLNIDYTYYASELDEYAIKVTQNNYPNTIQLGDVTKINLDLLPKIDLVVGGSPCQGFSQAGLKKEFDDPRSRLILKYFDIVEKLKPKYFLLENVVMSKYCENEISRILKVEPILINSALVSAQHRRRLYWTNIPNVTQPKNKKKYFNKEIRIRPHGWFEEKIYVAKKAPTLRTKNANFFVIENNKERLTTVKEWEELQTLPIGYTKDICKSRAFHAIGNSFTVDVIKHILSFINKKSTKHDIIQFY